MGDKRARLTSRELACSLACLSLLVLGLILTIMSHVAAGVPLTFLGVCGNTVVIFRHSGRIGREEAARHEQERQQRRLQQP